MKKLLLIAAFALFAVGASNVSAVAAKGNQTVTTTTITTVYEGSLLDYCVSGFEAYEYELLAGQSIDAGTVTITTDGEFFTITVNGLSIISDVHVYVYAEGDALPTKRPVPGQAPYKLENVNDTTASLDIPVGDGAAYTFAIHVAFTDVENDTTGVAGETAYAADQDAVFNGKGAWFYLVAFNVVECVEEPVDAPVLFIAAHAALTNSETAWALGQYSFIDEGIGKKWGWFLSVDTYGTHTFDIYYGAGGNSLTAGTLIGTLTVEYELEQVTVTYTLTQPLLDDVQVFAGYEAPTTGAPGQYDYKVEGLNGVYTVSVTIQLSDLEQ